jgi:sirohydrochlorin cobaltochelatase
MNDVNETTGLILFGHGARDARWREPFDRLLSVVGERHAGPVSLAFLEVMQPDLPTACSTLVERGATRIVVAPVFLGTGGHLRKDLPRLIASARAQAGVPVTAVDAVGEDPKVLVAVADYCLRCVA